MPDRPKRVLSSAGSLLRCVAGVVLPGVLLAACLFGDTVPVQTAPWLGPVFQEIVAACRDRETQWMVAVCLAIYLGSLLAVEWRLCGERFWRAGNAQLWLGALAVIALARYGLSYETAAASRQVLVLLGGIVLGKAARAWTFWPPEAPRRRQRTVWLLGWLALLLAGAALWQSDSGMVFQYRGAERWRGPWENPNLYGLLMGVGLVLAVGLAKQRREDGGWGMEDGTETGCQGPDAGCQIPDAGYQIPDPGCQMPDAGSRYLASGIRHLPPGPNPSTPPAYARLPPAARSSR